MADLLGLFAQAFGMARQRIALFAIVVAILTASGAAIDLSPDGAIGPVTLLYSLLSLYLQPLLIASVFDLDPFRTAGRRFPSVFALSLLFGIFVLFGLLLAIVPGLILLVRWGISLPVMLVEERGPYESLKRSWEMTAGRWGLAIALPGVLLLAWAPFIILSLLATYPAMPPPVILAVNFFNSVAIAFQWLLVAALYVRLGGRGSRSDLPQIFS